MKKGRKMARDRDERSSRRGSRDNEEVRSERGSRRGESRSSGYRYQPRTYEQAKKRTERSNSNFDVFIKDSVKMFKVNDGDNNIRILPPTWDGAEHYGLDIWVHYGIGPDNQAYLCLQKMKGEPCPICDERARNKVDEEYEKSLKPNERVLLFIIDRDDEKEGVQAWPCPPTVDREIMLRTVDKKTGESLPIDSPENGYDVEFTKNGKGLNTKYIGINIARRESELGNDKWMEFAVDNPLPELLVYYEYDHIMKAFGGQLSKSKSSDRDEEEDDRKESSRDKSSSRRGSSYHKEEKEDDELTWDQVHDMTFEELSAIVEDEKLDIDPDDTSSDEELADIVCKELEITKPRKKIGDDEKEDDSPKGRLEKMRRNRER